MRGSLPARLERQYRARVLGPLTRSYIAQLGVPVVAVTGTNGKTTVVRLLERALRGAGYRVGMACSDGVMRHGRWISSGDDAGILGLSRAVRGGDVDVLVAETARGGILQCGFGFRECRVAVVTNVSDDHLGADGVYTVDEMAAVKERLLERLAPDGAAVLNAGDPRVAAMAKRVSGRVVLFAGERLSASKADGVYLHGGVLHRREAGRDAPLIPAVDVGVAAGGFLVHNLWNAAAALAALQALAPALRVPDDVVRGVLRERLPAREAGPHAFHLVRYAGSDVLLCQSKNPAGFRIDARNVARLREARGYDTVVGFITHVGDRTAEFYAAVAREAAGSCDQVAAVPPRPQFLRGRSPEQLIALLEAGIPAAKLRPSRAGACAELLGDARSGHPGRLLTVFFNSRQHRGALDLLGRGQELPLSPGAAAPRRGNAP